MKIFGSIYKITNLLNGKSYIGQTVQTIEQRFKNHVRCKKYALGGAIEKYGAENFRVELICCAFNQEELDELEIFYITKFSTSSPNGYNIKSGGCKGVLPEESRRKLSELKKGKRPYDRTPEIQEKINKSRLEIGATGPNKTSKYKGIGWDKKHKKWRASVENKTLGYWNYFNEDEKTCSKIRDLYIYKNISINGYLNFPNEIYTEEEAINIMMKNAEVVNRPNKFLLQLLAESGLEYIPREKCDNAVQTEEKKYVGVSWNKSLGKWVVQLEYKKTEKWSYYNNDQLLCAKMRDLFIYVNNLDNKMNFPDDILSIEDGIKLLKNTYSFGRNIRKNIFLKQLQEKLDGGK